MSAHHNIYRAFANNFPVVFRFNSADEHSYLSNRNAALATAALLSGHAAGSCLTEGSVSSATSTTSSVMVSRAPSRMMAMAREVNFANLLRHLPPKSLAYVEMCVTRMADSRRRRRASMTTATESAENVAFSAAVDVQHSDVAGGSVLDARSVVSDIAAPVDETQEATNGATSAPLTDVYALLRQKAGFADLASEILSSVMMDLVQDALVDNRE